MTLQEMLGHVTQEQDALLFYEISEHSIVEMETKQYVSVTWLDAELKEHPHQLLVAKNSNLGAVRDELLNKLKLDHGRQYRLYEVSQHKVYGNFTESQSISVLRPDIAQLFIEVFFKMNYIRQSQKKN